MSNVKLPKVKESEVQAHIFQWASYIRPLKYMFAIPNGGSRDVREAVNLKRQGVKRGVSDIFVPMPTQNYHGLFLELKVGKNKPTKEQIDFLKFVNSVGYCGVVCYGFEEAVTTIQNYLKGEIIQQSLE